MIKRYISLYEMLCILAITSITGSMATKLFMEFIRNSQALEQKQQSQHSLKNIVRSLRMWAADSHEKIEETGGLWYSGKNEVYQQGDMIVFKVKGKLLENKIPKGYSIDISTDTTNSGEQLIVVKATKKGLCYSVKLKLEGES